MTMISKFRIFLVTATLLPGALRADPAAGDSRDRVIAELGQPASRLGVSSRELLTYDRGTVLIVDGKVSKVSLISAAEQQRLADERVREENTRKEAAAQTEARTQADEEALSALMGTATWKQASGSEKVTLLLRFSTEHPYADIRDATATSEKSRDRDAELNSRILALEAKSAASHDRYVSAKKRREDEAAAAAEARANGDFTVIYGTGYGRLRASRRPPVTPQAAPAPDINRATPDLHANPASPDINANRATPPNPVAPKPAPKPPAHSGSKEHTS